MPNIVVDISDLGLGHLAQTAPVLKRIAAIMPAANIIVRTRHRYECVREFFQVNFCRGEPIDDAQIFTIGPNGYDKLRTANSFRKVHSNWDKKVDIETKRLMQYKPDIVLSNISYLSVAAATRIDVPCICLCSINWLDFVRSYLPELDDDRAIRDTIAQCYRAAKLFIKPVPHMPMADLPNGRSIGPISRIGLDRRIDLRAHFRIPPGRKIALVTFGGVSVTAPLQIPKMPDVVWIVQGDLAERRSDTITLTEVPYSFIDVVASVDLVIGKDSYGVVTEAACNGVPLLILSRHGSMEADSLLKWASEVGGAASYEGEFGKPGFDRAVSRILERPRPPRVGATGIAQAADLIVSEAYAARGKM